MMQVMHGVVGTLWLSVVAVSIFGWARFLKHRTVGTVAVPYESRRLVPWGLFDLLLILVGIVMVQVVAGSIAAPLLDEKTIESSPVVWMGVSQGALLVAMGLIVVLMRFRSAMPTIDLGLVFRRSDIKLGAFAFAMMAVPMFALQTFLSRFTDAQHPLVESLIEDSSTSFFLVGGFSAVIVAPIVEEFLFRVFLQGWLENLAAYRLAQRRGVRFLNGFGADLFWGLGRNHRVGLQVESRDAAGRVVKSGPAVDSGQVVHESTADESPSDQSVVDGVEANPYASPDIAHDTLAASAEPLTEVGPPADLLPMRPAWWPILVSAALFAAAHLGNGPDPIPLFFLAIGLGLLYQRTHRVWPCITVHCMLNFISMFNLWVIVNSPELSEQLLKSR